MFSLIITIISIALVAALALATMYFGGSAFNVGVAKAAATKFITQSQQLQGAAAIYKTDFGAYPTKLTDMVDKGYLISVPTAKADNELPSEFRQASYRSSDQGIQGGMRQTGYVAPAIPAGTSAPWVMLVAEHPVFMMAPVPESVCRSLNQQSYGQAGILKSVHASLNSQCYGDDLNNLTIVSSSSGAELLIVAADPASAGALGTINTAPTPTDTANADWLVAPDAAPTVTAPANPVTGGGAIIAVDGQGQPVSLLTFVDTPVGLVLGTRTAQFKNTTAAAVDLASVSVPSPFSISYEDCSGVSLAPDQTCTVSVAFTPLAAQTYTGSGFAINLVTTAGAHSLLALSGTGLVAAPYISVTSHGFGAVDSPSGFGWMPGQWFGAGTIDPAISSDWVVASAQYSPDGWSINRGAFAQDIVISFPQPSSNMTVTGVTYSYTGRGTVPIDNADVICDTVSCVVTPSALMLEGTGVAPASLTVTVTYSTATITGVVLTRSFPIKLADPWY